MTGPAARPVGVQLCDTCGEVRRETALVPVDGGGWRCAEPCRKPGGRPPIGPPVLIRMPVELRAAVEALALPGEKLAATARRLLAAAVADARADREPAACSACGRWHQGWIPPGCPLSDAGSEAAPAPAGALASAAVQLPEHEGAELPETGKRVVLAYTWRGEPVVIGPVYTPKGSAAIEDAVNDSPEARGWRVTGTVRLISKADLEWSWES